MAQPERFFQAFTESEGCYLSRASYLVTKMRTPRAPRPHTSPQLDADISGGGGGGGRGGGGGGSGGDGGGGGAGGGGSGGGGGGSSDGGGGVGAPRAPLPKYVLILDLGSGGGTRCPRAPHVRAFEDLVCVANLEPGAYPRPHLSST